MILKTQRIALVAATAGLAVVLFGGAANAVRPLDTPPANPGQGAPQPPKSCNAVVAGLTGMNLARSDHPEPICGTNEKDVLRATHGPGAIWGYRGNDTLRSANGDPDEVIGGDGIDTATIDACDTPTSIEKITRKPCNSVTPFHTSLYGTGTTDYPVWAPTIECTQMSDGRRLMRFLEDPELRAVDATDNVDWQTVAWKGAVFKWDGTQWQPLAQSSWLWDRTYDLQVEAFPGNYWRSFTNGKRTFLSYKPDSPGWYRVAFYAHWYATPRVAAHDEAYWGGPHYGPFEDPTQTWCAFT